MRFLHHILSWSLLGTVLAISLAGTGCYDRYRYRNRDHHGHHRHHQTERYDRNHR
jgi:hypothetical protein